MIVLLRIAAFLSELICRRFHNAKKTQDSGEAVATAAVDDDEFGDANDSAKARIGSEDDFREMQWS
jgi:hypothetical protein